MIADLRIPIHSNLQFLSLHQNTDGNYEEKYHVRFTDGYIHEHIGKNSDEYLVIIVIA